MFNHESLKVYFRGEIVPFEKATISIANTGFLYGLGVFTGMRAHYNSSERKLFLFRPECHYERFYQACKLMRYTGFLENYTYKKFLQVITELLEANKIAEDVYIRVTNFTDENLVTPKFIGYKDSLSAFIYPLGDYVPTGGMRCKVSSWTRVDDNSMPLRSKINGVYVNTAFAKTEALIGGYDEAIFLDRSGHAVEGSAENLFIVNKGEIITPPPSDNILEGVTRRSVIEIAREQGTTVVERSIDRTELYKADEIFLTGTGAKVSPVIEVDNYEIGDGQVGPISKKLQDTYSKIVRGDESDFANWVVEV